MNLNHATILKNFGFLLIDEVLSPSILTALRSYTDLLHQMGMLEKKHSLTEGLCRIRDSFIDDLVLHNSLSTISDLVGHPLKASYSFLIRYEEGMVLPPHRDHNACTWNLGIILEQEESVPFRLRSPGGEEYAVNLEVNQGLLYQGRDWMHGRDRINRGHLVSVLCHFVDAAEDVGSG